MHWGYNPRSRWRGGLTDAEIAQMTERLQGIALAPEEHGDRTVGPEQDRARRAFDGLQ